MGLFFFSHELDLHETALDGEKKVEFKGMVRHFLVAMIIKLTALLAALSLISVSTAAACGGSCGSKGAKDKAGDSAVVSFDVGGTDCGGGSCGKGKSDA